MTHRDEGQADEKDEFSIFDVIAFQRRLQEDPDAVSDDEIRAEYGADIPPDEMRELFRRSRSGKGAKDPRASAREKLRRRLVWLTRSLESVEHAVNDVLQAPGRTYKKKELSELLDAIEQFRGMVKLPKSDVDSPLDPDFVERFLSGQRTDWKPLPSDSDREDE